MRIEKITFMETFPTAAYANVRLGVEGTLEPGESIEDAFVHARQKILDSFNKMNPHIEGLLSSHQGLQAPHYISPTVNVPVINKEVERLEILIDNAKTIAELESYRTKAIEYGLIEQLEQRIKELTIQL